MLLVFTVPWTPVRGSHFSTGVVMRADLLFRGCIGALRANLRHSSCIVGKCESGHGKDQDECLRSPRLARFHNGWWEV